MEGGKLREAPSRNIVPSTLATETPGPVGTGREEPAPRGEPQPAGEPSVGEEEAKAQTLLALEKELGETANNATLMEPYHPFWLHRTS